jgi:hypothetical protein
MNNRASYIFKAIHQSFDKDEHETNIYEWIFHVEELDSFQSTFYDSELKMNLIDESKTSRIFEIEIDNMKASLCPRLKKAEDFIRRINYRYDWMQLKVRNDGKILFIVNRDELKSTWKELRESIEGDYSGYFVDEYIEDTNSWFQSDDNIREPIYQYFHFALLFPQIPLMHPARWSNKRKIEFSEYEKEYFDETIEFIEVKDDVREYKITGIKMTESKVEIKKYEGNIYCRINNLLVEKAEVKIDFSFSELINQWYFELNKINANLE